MSRICLLRPWLLSDCARFFMSSWCPLIVERAGLADRWNEGQSSRMLTGWSLVAFAATFSDAIASDIAGLFTTAFTG